MTIAKTSAELEALLMEAVRAKPECEVLTGVVVTAEGAPGGWNVGAILRDGQRSVPDANRAIIAAVHDLRQQFHLQED